MKTLTTRDAISNPNVPRETFIIAAWETMSGEIGHALYATRQGDIYQVTDWTGDKPQPATQHQVYKLTGLPPAIINAAWETWKERGRNVTD